MMIAGLFLSKFDREGLKFLGFTSFVEAYNAMGYALGGKPNSIKNYMQEFDPMFPNQRRGWHKRTMREHCRDAYERYESFSIDSFYALLSPMLSLGKGQPPKGMEELAVLDEHSLSNDSFCKRIITGAAAEGFFETSFPTMTEFPGHGLKNVTRFGCGFDFRLQPPDDGSFIAVEVKGIAGNTGEVMMTAKEHQVAGYLKERYFLCVVRNFCERPVMSLFRNPLEQGPQFSFRDHTQVTRTWHARIPA